MTVDSTGSTGVDGSRLSYLWTLEEKPNASNLVLVTPTSQQAALTPDVAGTYRLKLVVSSGGRASEPAYTTIEAVPTGRLPAFVTFSASGIQSVDAMRMTGCSLFQPAANYPGFSDQFLKDCFGGPPDGDESLRWSFIAGGDLSEIASNVRYLRSGGMSGTSQATWWDVRTLSGYGYALSAEATSLAKVPAGKATGSVFTHTMSPAWVTSFSSGVIDYKIEGNFRPANVPPGWKAQANTKVLVTVGGVALENGRPVQVSAKVFERAFSADFSETIPLNLNWDDLPIKIDDLSARYEVTVTTRTSFARIRE